ncbi:MAG TPA: hypothetical protein IAB21_01615 [Candidatus Avelusimicrobium excrementipullorum]|nr:hypothetical protein [Candidatus Avelusimicrobium excrementipullorum]
MNIFKFLKSRIGAVSISAGKMAGVALTAGLVGVNVYNYATSSPAAQEARVRSFSEVLTSGGILPEDNTMNFALGNVQFASAEERAAQEGTIFDAGDADVSALQGAMNSFSVRGSALGAGEGGLGMGANAAVELGPDGKPLTGNAAGTDGAAVGAAAAAAAQGGQTKINKLGEEPAGGLQRASIARASGSNLGSSSAGGFGGNTRSSAAGNATAEAAARLRSSSSYALSGAMPKGSTLIASNGNIRGAAGGATEFVAGSRFGRSAMGARSQEGESLRDMALASSKVAANANRSANEGTSPFMARERLSGGITVEGENLNEFQGTADTSFEDDMNRRERGVAAAADEVDTSEQERKNHRSRLSKMLIALIPTVFMGMMTIQSMKSEGPWGMVAAIAVTAILGAAIIAFTVDAAKYIDKYGADGWSVASLIGSAVMAAGLVLAWINNTNAWLGKVSTFLFKNMGMSMISSAIFGTLMGQAISTAPETFKSAFGSEDDSSLKND